MSLNDPLTRASLEEYASVAQHARGLRNTLAIAAIAALILATGWAVGW